MSASVLKVDKVNVSEVKTETFTYQWKIKKFKYLFKQTGDMVDSPVFSFGSKKDIKWSIRLFPYGDSQENKGFLSLYLCWDRQDIFNGKVYLSLINDKQKKEAEVSAKLETKKEVEKAAKLAGWRACGFPIFFKFDKVLDKENGLLPDDYLIINCEFILFLECVKLIEKEEKQMPKPNLLKKLFLEDNFSDIKLVALCGKNLPAHRNVLAASSTVFEAMFKHELPEQRMSEVKIEEEFKVIKEMLCFVYLGEVEELKSIVFDLVKLADKYKISGLIELCERELINQISTDNVFQIITVAESYNMEQLKKYAIDFASKNLKNIVNSGNFQLSVYPEAVQSVLEAFGRL